MRILSLLAAVAMTCLQPAVASEWPTQSIRLIVPYSAGGPTDGLGRMLADKLSNKLGQPVVVLNKGGAGGTIGVSEVLRSTPDGYTLALVAPGPVAGRHALTEVNYPLDDIEYITLVAKNPAAIAVNKKLGITSLQQLIQRAKEQPGKLNFSSAGNGTTPHIGAELFRQQAGIDVVHVPYKGAAPAVAAVLAGDVDYVMADLPALLAQHRAGSLTILAVASPERAPQAPDIPTTRELGLDKVIMETNYGLVGPKGIPEDVLTRLRTAVKDVVSSPDMAKFVSDQGGVALASSGEEYEQLMREEYRKWKEVAEKGNITLN